MDNQLITTTQEADKQSVKIIKNTKGYQWEFRVFIENNKENETIDKCEKINNELIKRFGVIEE